MEDPPITVREGGMIREGYNEDADRLRHGEDGGQRHGWHQLEAEEREKTGIKNPRRLSTIRSLDTILRLRIPLRIWCRIIISRKQTLTNAERYTTDRLKELEDVILGAEDKLSVTGVRSVL